MQHTKEGVTAEQINALIDAETWKNGREWQEFFNIEVSEKNNAAACVSDYFEQYNKLPDELRENPEPQTVNIGSMVDAIAAATAQRLKETMQENRTPETDGDREKQIAAILEDLDLI